MDVIEAILTRRTSHFYEPTPVSPESVERALECAIRAPNHRLSNPWRFTKVGPKTREALVELGVRFKNEKRPLSEAEERKVRDKLGTPPLLIVVSQVLDPDDHRRREDYAACACAIQNMALALWSEGISSKWSTGGVTRHPETYRMLGIDPEAEEIIGFVWIGYARRRVDTPRRGLDEVSREVE